MGGKSDLGSPRMPAYLETAWGLRERASRGPKPALSLERIVGAAVKVAASEGLQAVSMSRIAGDLSAAPMSLYRYLPSKDDLLQLMADAVYEVAPPTPAPGECWRSGLSRWAWANHAILRQHPWVVQIPIVGPPMMPNQVLWLERGLECLRDIGLEEGAKLSIMMLVAGLARNEVMVSAQVRSAFMAAATSDSDAMVSFDLLARRLADQERFPRFNEVIRAGVLETPNAPDDEFRFGLERVLDGIEALVTRRRGGGAG
jgi:AcrR family transcriptional regulator